MKVLIAVCDRCDGLEDLVLHSGDEQHHLCEECVALFLETIFNPASSRQVIPLEDGEKAVCVFCGGTWMNTDAAETLLFLIMKEKGEELVCDGCLLAAARRSGKFRIIKDC